MESDYWQSTVQWASVGIFLLLVVAVFFLAKVDLTDAKRKRKP